MLSPARPPRQRLTGMPMTIDKKQILTDLFLSHKEALAQVEEDFNRYHPNPSTCQDESLHKTQKNSANALNSLRKIVKSYELLAQKVPGKLSSAQVGSVVVVRMGINNEKRSYFIHNGFLIDPMRWHLRYPSASNVCLGDMQTFGGLKVGDTYVSYEGRTGDEIKSTNHVVEIL